MRTIITVIAMRNDKHVIKTVNAEQVYKRFVQRNASIVKSVYLVLSLHT